MFDNVVMTKKQRMALENSIDNLIMNGIHGIITISDDFVDTENEDNSYTLIDNEIIYTICVPLDKYKKAIIVTDRESILFSLAPISVIVDFECKGIKDDF